MTGSGALRASGTPERVMRVAGRNEGTSRNEGLTGTKN